MDFMKIIIVILHRISTILFRQIDNLHYVLNMTYIF